MRSFRLVALISGVVATGIVLALPTLSPVRAQQPGVLGLPGGPGQPPIPLLTQQRVHGIIQEVDGPTLTFRADDGRTLTVDMSQIGEDVRGALTPGEGATVVGVPGDEPHRLTARYIQQVPPSEPSPRPIE
jgi:hypothetical protein